MAAFVVVSPDVVVDSLACLLNVVVLCQISLLVLEGAEPALDHDVVSPAALAVHALPDVVIFQELLVFTAGELAPLIRVEDNRLGHLEGLPERRDDHACVKRIVYLPADDVAAVPVDDGRQIQESVLDGNVGDINGPCLIGPVDNYVTQQVWHDLRVLQALGKVHLWINSLDAHLAHVTRCLAPADVATTPLQLPRHLAGAPGRIVRMQMVDDCLAVQLLLGVYPRSMRIVRTGPVDFQQLGGFPHGDLRLLTLRKVSE